MPTTDKALTVNCPCCNHDFNIILSITPRNVTPRPVLPRVDTGRPQSNQQDAQLEHDSIALPGFNELQARIDGKRFMCCSGCNTHTEQVAIDVGGGFCRWECLICGHQPKKRWQKV